MRCQDNITDEMINEAWEKVHARHLARGEALKAERAKASAEFLEKQAEKERIIKESMLQEVQRGEIVDILSKYGKYALIVICILGGILKKPAMANVKKLFLYFFFY